MKQAIILAGGKGTRLKDRLGDLPKPMIPVAGRPLLEHQVELGRMHGFTDFVFFVHHRADLIEAHFGDGSQRGVRIRYVHEQEPLGTAGAVLAGFEQVSERFVVLYGDTMVNVDLTRLWQAHEQSCAGGTLLLHPNNHPLDSDLVEVDASSRVVAFHNRPHAPGVWRQNLVNAGLYVLEKRALEPFRNADRRGELHEPPTSDSRDRSGTRVTRPSGVLDFGKDLFPAMLRGGAFLLGYNSPEFIKDIGTPERYDRVCAQFASGAIQRSSLATPQRAVFLDRDGTLIEEVSELGLTSPDQVRLLPGAADAVHRLNEAGWRAVLVTNQPVIAKGLCTEAELQVIHNKLETLLGMEHGFLDRIYFCPHHPKKGFAGERADLKIECDCRKPKTGMIQHAVRDLSIDLAQSWLIGDTTTDLQTAKNAGLRSILVGTGHGGKDGKHEAEPDFACATLLEAASLLLKQKSP